MDDGPRSVPPARFKQGWLQAQPRPKQPLRGEFLFPPPNPVAYFVWRHMWHRRCIIPSGDHLWIDRVGRDDGTKTCIGCGIVDCERPWRKLLQLYMTVPRR